MDEAFSALDPLIRHEMQGELIRLQAEQHRTIIFISHDIDEAIRIGHRIAIMEGGQVVQIGTPQELLCNPANDYVRAFFKGFDASKILKAGDVAKICAEHPYAMDQSTPTLRDDVLLRTSFTSLLMPLIQLPCSIARVCSKARSPRAYCFNNEPTLTGSICWLARLGHSGDDMNEFNFLDPFNPSTSLWANG